MNEGEINPFSQSTPIQDKVIMEAAVSKLAREFTPSNTPLSLILTMREHDGVVREYVEKLFAFPEKSLLNEKLLLQKNISQLYRLLQTIDPREKEYDTTSDRIEKSMKKVEAISLAQKVHTNMIGNNMTLNDLDRYEQDNKPDENTVRDN